MYQEDHPDSDLRFVFEDHRYDGKTSISVLQKFKNIDKVDYAVVWGNTPSSTCAPVAERIELPMLGISFNPDAKGRKMVMTFGPKIEDHIDQVVAQFDRWKLETPAAVSIDIGNAVQGVEMLAERLSGKLITKFITNDEADFKSLLVQLRSKGVDGLLLFLMPQQAITFIRQADELEYPLKIVGGDIFAEDAFYESISSYSSEVAFVYGGVSQSFVNRIVKQWSSKSYFYETASGYAIAKLFEAFNGDKIRIEEIDKTAMPVLGFQFRNDQAFGRHFGVKSMIYSSVGDSRQ